MTPTQTLHFFSGNPFKNNHRIVWFDPTQIWDHDSWHLLIHHRSKHVTTPNLCLLCFLETFGSDADFFMPLSKLLGFGALGHPKPRCVVSSICANFENTKCNHSIQEINIRIPTHIMYMLLAFYIFLPKTSPKAQQKVGCFTTILSNHEAKYCSQATISIANQ